MNEAPTNVPSPASSVAIEAIGLEKAYGAGLAALLSPKAVRAQDPALAGITFSLPVGAALAVLGRNGAGKSTLLRLLAGTALPTRGSLRICGRVGLLLDLGSGLVDEMTGAETVRASLRLLGLGGRDLATAEQFVAGFADLGSFLLETVRVYSQG
ncbi:MAG: ATP-binding cassette domain-containing protein, partial [Candidatus Binatia bacterium]|nr:ATP-binding cassette domain-containing protein [Candidatus Binatia bacterium]